MTINAVTLIAGMPFDVKLRCPRIAPRHLDHKVNVRRRPRRIRHGFDCAKAILTIRSRLKATKALKVWIETAGAFLIALLQVSTRVVDLPNFDDRALNRCAMRV